MAEHDVRDVLDESLRRRATIALLDDLRALERLLAERRIEKGARRIGAEQELFLVDRAMRPAPVATAVLERLCSLPFTTEIAQFNLEANLPPVFLGAGALSGLERSLNDLVAAADREAGKSEARVVLTGILPTLAVSDLTLDNISPNPRYRALNDTLAAWRDDAFHLRIDGLDRFELRHDNVMFESCNTSFQLHLQVDADEFAELYNLSQAISAPLLAAATNSPLLLGHRLWAETRIALFEHATDARSEGQRARRQPPRVRFGDAWVESSILELLREDAARFPLVVAAPHDESPFDALDAGRAPKLRALCAHNGTIWRWNRGCYGVTDGVPHLRIENRVLPSGPTVLDEVANAALFYGLMTELPRAYGRIDRRMPFDDAKRNFFAAAREGLLAQLNWIDGRTSPAHKLLLEELLPLAERGLAHAGVEASEIARYLGVIEERVRTRKTGADWSLAGFAAIEGNTDRRGRALVAAMIDHQHSGEPVHRWEPLVDDNRYLPAMDPTLDRIMTSNALTVRAEDPVELARTLMTWNHLGHIAVEDETGRALGLVSLHCLEGLDPRIAIRDVMDLDAVQAAPELSIHDAYALMRDRGAVALLIVRDGQLLGTVSAREVLDAMERRSRSSFAA
jgi:CBS domain-containing protein